MAEINSLEELGKLLVVMEENTQYYCDTEVEPFRKGYYEGQMNLIKNLRLKLQY